jgi:hypothetical protein
MRAGDGRACACINCRLVQQPGQYTSSHGSPAVTAHRITDQDGAGATIAVWRGSVACPVAAVLKWLAASGISGVNCLSGSQKAGAA